MQTIGGEGVLPQQQTGWKIRIFFYCIKKGLLMNYFKGQMNQTLDFFSFEFNVFIKYKINTF